MRKGHISLIGGIFLLAVVSQAHAALQITVGDLALVPGETASLNVMIHSDTGTDLLDMFGLEFRITTGGSTRLEFVNPPTDPQLTDANYILFGDSLAALFPPAGSISSVLAVNDTYIGGDATVSALGVLVPTTDTLLATLEVTAATANPPAPGDTFTISLEPDLNTFFYDPMFTPINFSSTSGTVSVIPEASSLVVWSLLAICGIITVSRRPRRRRGSACGNDLFRWV